MSVNEKIASSTELWEVWLASSLGQLRSAGLTRILRPVMPTLSAIQVHTTDSMIKAIDRQAGVESWVYLQALCVLVGACSWRRASTMDRGRGGTPLPGGHPARWGSEVVQHE